MNANIAFFSLSVFGNGRGTFITYHPWRVFTQLHPEYSDGLSYPISALSGTFVIEKTGNTVWLHLEGVEGAEWNYESFDVGDGEMSANVYVTLDKTGDSIDFTGYELQRFAPPETREQILSYLTEEIGSLRDASTLTKGQENALLKKLGNIAKHLEQGSDRTASNMVRAYVNHVESLTEEGVLSTEEANSLVTYANAIIDAPSGPAAKPTAAGVESTAWGDIKASVR
ncbi:MAG: hypothetical protein O2782_03760 [bacterium]|nr:hypothetical protein [bacterium]